MRVIKKNEQEKIHKCRNCKSIIAYKPEEVDCFWGNQIRCPVCKNLDLTSIFDRRVK